MDYGKSEAPAPFCDQKNLRELAGKTRGILRETQMQLYEALGRLVKANVPEEKRPEPECVMEEMEMLLDMAIECREMCARLNELI